MRHRFRTRHRLTDDYDMNAFDFEINNAPSNSISSTIDNIPYKHESERLTFNGEFAPSVSSYQPIYPYLK